MNRYAILARDWWSKNAPERLASLEDPETFFQALGESAAAQIAEIEDQQRATLPQGLTYLETVGRLQSIRKQAEEVVLSDLVYSLPAEMTLLDEIDDLTGNLPGISGIDAMIDRLNDQAEREAEIEDRESTLDDEQLHRLHQLTRLRALLVQAANPDQLTAAEQRDLVLALRAFWDETTGAPAL